MAKDKDILSPRQTDFLARYTNPNSDTFGNAMQSAISAGYSKEYAENITGQLPNWLSENLGRSKLLSKAEKVLEKTLDYQTEDAEGKTDVPLLRVQADVAKFTAERLGKKDYSTRTDITSGGQPIALVFDNSFNATPPSTEKNSRE